MTNIVRNGSPYLVGALVLLGAAVFLLRSESRDRLEKGESFEREGKLVEAIEQYEWAIQAYSPGDPSFENALDRLEAIAHESETKDATQTEIQSWQAIVSGLTVTRHLSQPAAGVLSEARNRLKELRGDSASPSNPSEGSEPLDPPREGGS